MRPYVLNHDVDFEEGTESFIRCRWKGNAILKKKNKKNKKMMEMTKFDRTMG